MTTTNSQPKIPTQIQQQVAMFQQVQQQLQQVSSQKLQYEMTLRETKRALEELNSVSEDTIVYSSVGSILIQKKKDAVISDLKEKIDSIELRVGSLEKQEKTMADKANMLQKQVKDAIANSSGKQ
ncbi:MAG TPA: prefoldin subunit beta [Methanocorpusculum sp.]|nr:prefoldin subunit beta [Methanocorpusculum sp.]